MAATPPFYDITDLHALADGELGRVEAERLQAALTAPDSARVAQWRRQNELLRATFGKIAMEPVPLSLSVLPHARPALRAVPAQPRVAPARGRRWGPLAGLVCALGVAVAAVVLLSGLLDMPAAPPRAGTAGADVSADVGVGLATSTLAAVDDKRAVDACRGCGATDAAALRLPNLGKAGLTLQSGDMTETAAGASACGLYADRFGVRLALCALHAASVDEPLPKVAAAHAVVWHEAGTVYALAGPLSQGDLLALSLRVHAAMAAAR